MRWAAERAGLLVVVLIVLSALAVPMPATARTKQSGLVGRQAPNFQLKDFENKTVRLSEYRGKVVLLNFWASWCAPCQAEMPVFAKWQKQYAGKLQVLGISMDDDLSHAKSAARKLKVNYPVLAGSEQVGEAYGGIYGLPETFLIDSHGKVRAAFQGGNHLAAIHAEIKRLMSNPALPERP